MCGTCSTDGIYDKCIQNFNPETLRDQPLGRHKRRLKDNIKTGLNNIVVWILLDSFDPGQGSAARSIEHGNEPSGSLNGGTFLH
jgi:hypothetical protein